MRVLTICGAGLGCSLLLKMFAQDVFDKLGVSVEIEASDVAFAKGTRADLIITSGTLVATLSEIKTPIIAIRNLMDKRELEDKIRAHLEGLEGAGPSR